jgi:hypothetical protein
MKREEMSLILTMVSSLDRQPVDEGMVEMWLELFKSYDFESVKAAIIPAYKESKSGFITAKLIYDYLRRESQYPKPRQWVWDLHQMGQHFECRAGEFGHPEKVSA